MCATAEAEHLDELGDRAAAAVLALPTGGARVGRAELDPAAGGRPPARAVGAPVGWVGLAYPTVAYAHPDGPALAALARRLRAARLMPEVRESGGAYSAGAWADGETGALVMTSERDPQVARTLAVFRGSGRWALDNPASPAEAEMAVLEAWAGQDPPASPDVAGRDRFFGDLAGYTLERRAAHRRALLAVGAGDLERAAGRYLLGGGSAAVVAGGPPLEEALSSTAEGFEALPW